MHGGPFIFYYGCSAYRTHHRTQYRNQYRRAYYTAYRNRVTNICCPGYRDYPECNRELKPNNFRIACIMSLIDKCKVTKQTDRQTNSSHNKQSHHARTNMQDTSIGHQLYVGNQYSYVSTRMLRDIWPHLVTFDLTHPFVHVQLVSSYSILSNPSLSATYIAVAAITVEFHCHQ